MMISPRLLAGGDDDEDDSDSDSDDDDDDLAALLAGGDDDDDESDSDSDDDDDLAALLGGDDDDDADSGDSDDDDDLAALLAGGDDDDDESDSDSDDDDDLAALLGGDDDDDADSGDSDDDDDDLAALLAGGDDDDDSDSESDDDDDGDADSGDGDTPEEDPFEEDSIASENSMASDVAQDLPMLIEQAQEATGYGKQGSPPVIDLVSLLQPIEGDDPAGGGIPYDVKERLEEARKEINPNSFNEDDPLRPEERVYADWKGIHELTEKTLRETSKNLLIAARLTEAITKLHGFAGLRDGLLLLRLMVEICWDRINPAIDDEDDLEVRAAPFVWLDDPNRGARFPSTVRMTPVLLTDKANYSCQDWQQAQQEGSGSSVVEEFEAAIYASSKEECHTRASDIKQCLMELQALDNQLNSKLASDAPGFSALGPAIHEASTLMQQILQKVGPLDDASEDEESADDADTAEGDAPSGDGGSGGGKAAAGPRPKTRDDWYRQLAEAAAALQRMEPHSPIPYLIQRAVELGSLPFPQLMRQLIRENAVLEEMDRELGIRQKESEGDSY